MSENKPVKLSELQLTVMKVLWQHQRLSVSEAQQLLNEQKPMALTTVATLLKRMHEKNIVHAEKQGRQFFYSPATTEAEVKTSMLSNLLNHLFDGNPSELVHHLVAQDEVKQDDIAKIQQLIDQEKSND